MINRIVSIIIAFALIIGGVAFGEEAITLHNGTKFGMTKEDVYDLEASNGVLLAEDGEYTLIGETIIANQANTRLYYYFRDNRLFEMDYSFADTDTYNVVEDGLNKKYGETTFTSSTGLSLPDIDIDGEEINIKESSTIRGFDIEVSPYSQRIVQVNENNYMLIQHFVEYDYLPSGTLMMEQHSVYYWLLSDLQANEYLALISPSDDL